MENYLSHHGIKGQKWGVRRFQNKDGTLTTAGKKRYDSYEYTGDKEKDKFVEKAASVYEKHITSDTNKKINSLYEKLIKEGTLSDDEFSELNKAFEKSDRDLWSELEKIENNRFKVVGRSGGTIHESDLKFAKLGKEWLDGSQEGLQLQDMKTGEPAFLRYAVLGEKYVMLDSYWENEDFW